MTSTGIPFGKIGLLALVAACGTTIGTGGPLAKTLPAIATTPNVDLHIIDINPTFLKNEGDRQTDPPDNVESRYYWSAEPEWGPIQRIRPKPYSGDPMKWGRSTSNGPITAIYRVTVNKRLLFFKRGETIVCYVNPIDLSQDTTTDAEADPTALTESRIVLGFSIKDLTDSPKVETSCDGFDQIKNIDKGQ